ncbi:MAG: magnesium transporter [Eubacteriales bacterium]
MDKRLKEHQKHLTKCVENKDWKELKEALSYMNEVDIADYLELQKVDLQAVIFRILPKEIAAGVFSYFSNTKTQEKLIEALSDMELKEVLEELYLDDTVDIIEDMPSSVVTRILQQSNPSTRDSIHQILNYPKDCAGTVMTTEFIHLSKDITIKEAFQKIRSLSLESETIYTCYVVEERQLLGLITVRQLLMAEESDPIIDFMDSNYQFVHAHDDKEEVALLFSKYDLSVVPVVDGERRIVGIITVDDVMDVLQEETTEDFEKMAGISPSDKPYLQSSVWETCQARIPWLMLLMLSATFTGLIISHFESALATTVILASFIPMLSGTGGNSGSQASVAVIRAISLGEVGFDNIYKVLWKEIRVAVFCGMALATGNFIKMMVVDAFLMGNPEVTPVVAFVVCATLVLTVLCAKVVGCILPIIADRFGVDPAVMAAPFITTVVDALSLLIYFTIATHFLHST